MTAERLKKEQLIEALVNAGKVDTKKGAVELIESVDAVIEVASELVEVGQKIALGKYISLEEVNVAEKEGRNLYRNLMSFSFSRFCLLFC